MDKKLLEQLYIDQDLSQRDVAKKLNLSQSSVRYYLDKYDIKKLKSHDYSIADQQKKCSKCAEIKSFSDFYKRRDRNNTLSSWCKRCMNDNVISRQQNTKKLAAEYKGGSCKFCGFNKYLGALEFHHIDPNEKDFDISKIGRHKSTLNGLAPFIKEELDKCILVCANCHRMIHAGLI